LHLLHKKEITEGMGFSGNSYIQPFQAAEVESICCVLPFV